VCTGLAMDGANAYPEMGIYQEFITVDNIIELFEKYGVQRDFDLLSVDVGMCYDRLD
jgi:hypothetical protein